MKCCCSCCGCGCLSSSLVLLVELKFLLLVCCWSGSTLWFCRVSNKICWCCTAEVLFVCWMILFSLVFIIILQHLLLADCRISSYVLQCGCCSVVLRASVSLVFILLQHLVLVGYRVGSIVLQCECCNVALRAYMFLVFIFILRQLVLVDCWIDSIVLFFNSFFVDFISCNFKHKLLSCYTFSLRRDVEVYKCPFLL